MIEKVIATYIVEGDDGFHLTYNQLDTNDSRNILLTVEGENRELSLCKEEGASLSETACTHAQVSTKLLRELNKDV